MKLLHIIFPSAFTEVEDARPKCQCLKKMSKEMPKIYVVIFPKDVERHVLFNILNLVFGFFCFTWYLFHSLYFCLH